VTPDWNNVIKLDANGKFESAVELNPPSVSTTAKGEFKLLFTKYEEKMKANDEEGAALARLAS
jgi:hypothetical protein